MLKVNRELCLGCGLCMESCPRQAISLDSAKAQINQARCNQCRHCLDVCPQRAIIEVSPVPTHELQAVVTGLQDRAADIITRIDRLKGSDDNATQDKV